MLAFGGCTSSSGSTQPEVRSDGSPSQTVSAASGDSARLQCGEYIGAHPPVRGLKVVLGVVALPTSGSGPALGTALTKDSAFPRLFAKTGLLIKEGASFRIIIPAGSGDRIGIGWGSPATPSRTVVVRHCRAVGLPSRWMAYAGGYWLDHPACVTMQIRTGGRQKVVHIGVGTPCPGQRPPPNPSAT